MRVISYNIQYGRGRDGVIDLVRSCNAIRGADNTGSAVAISIRPPKFRACCRATMRFMVRVSMSMRAPLPRMAQSLTGAVVTAT
jgi:hypothetical protein